MFLAPTARDWLCLLRALEQPPGPAGARRSADPVRRLDLPRQLADSGEAGNPDDLGQLLRRWRDVLAERGVAALLEVMTSKGLAERLLGTDDGERWLTDVRHIGQALHAAAVTARLGLAATVEWCSGGSTRRPKTWPRNAAGRLESDADAVQVVTIHGAKGLQFPVVYVPYGWDRYVPDNPDFKL